MPGVLLATHGATTADGAVRIAALLADRKHTTLNAICVQEPLRVYDGGYEALYVPSLEEEEAVRASMRSAVNEQLARCGVTCSLQVRSGIPSTTIANAAQELGADLIVLGLGRHDLLERVLGNETALQLVQLASAPVLAVPQEMQSLPHHILAASDFSPTSIASVKRTARWLTRGDVLHVAYVAGEWRGGYPIEQRVSAESFLAALARQIEPPDGVVVELSVEEGDPAVRLLELAARQKADMLVMGSHGYGFWKRLTIGSVASKVIRLANLAVYVTPIGCLGAQSTLATALSASTSDEAASAG
ncbi:MAG TPA: universal stress protein [Gemmatimonadaceae bacterium]|jgi:nucleotide-binding universal stress UspA family protein